MDVAGEHVRALDPARLMPQREWPCAQRAVHHGDAEIGGWVSSTAVVIPPNQEEVEAA